MSVAAHEITKSAFVQVFGSVVEAASALGVAPTTLYDWSKPNNPLTDRQRHEMLGVIVDQGKVRELRRALDRDAACNRAAA